MNQCITESVIRESMISADKGTNICDLLDRIAFKLHERYPDNSDINNADLAREIFIKYSLDNKFTIEGNRPLSDSIAYLLETETDRYGRAFSDNSRLVNEMEAKNSVVDLVLAHYERRLIFGETLSPKRSFT